MVDPVIVCPTSDPDLIFGLTSTGWTAIGSAIGAVSVLALVAFNWRFVRYARDQTNAAMTQATVATTTLNNLQKQLSDQQELERQSALVVLQEALAHVVLWSSRVKTATASESNPIQLLPDGWSVLTIFIARRFPVLTPRIQQAGQQLRDAQINLNEVLQIGFQNRAGNSSASLIVNRLLSRLDGLKVSLQEIEKAFPPALIPS